MSVEQFISAMPKVELSVRLEGAFRRDVLMLIAEQNEIAAETKRFQDVVAQWDNPDYSQIDKTLRTFCGWPRHKDDLTRIVYDAGLWLSKQNVKYAEISVNPAMQMLSGMSFEEFMGVLNDGRDRVIRGWGVKINWILTVPRDEPRRADETFRWASSATGRKSGIVGFGLVGSEGEQPIKQFERAFHAAVKKEFPTIIQASNITDGDSLKSAMEMQPNRLIDGWGILDSPDIQDQMIQNDLPLVVGMGRAKRHGWIENIADYPLRQLKDAHLPIVISAEMPGVYDSTLNDEYLAAVNECGLTIDELIEISLNAIQYSLLPADEKAVLVTDFLSEIAELQAEHLTSSESEAS